MCTVMALFECTKTLAHWNIEANLLFIKIDGKTFGLMNVEEKKEANGTRVLLAFYSASVPHSD